MFAYIPARGGSKRIPRKNIRPLAGRPILLRVVDALKKVPGLKGIGVSSDDPEILAMAEAAGARTLGPRDPALSDDKTGFAELAKLDAPRYAKAFGSDSCLFVTATAALVRPEHYAEAMMLHSKTPSGLVIAVTKYDSSPWLALSGDPAAGLTPAFPDMYLMPTKDLPLACTDAGCFYALHLGELAGKESFLDLGPIRGVVLPREIGIDVDTEEDWLRLERVLAGNGTIR